MMTKLMMIIITSMFLLLPQDIMACVCASPSQYFEILQGETIVIRGKILSITEDIKEEVNEERATYDRRSIIYNFELLEVIEGTIDRESIELEQNLYGEITGRPERCDTSCQDWVSEDLLISDELKTNQEYLVYGELTENDSRVILNVAIPISDNKISTDFLSYEKGTDLSVILGEENADVVPDLLRITLPVLLIISLILLIIFYKKKQRNN